MRVVLVGPGHPPAGGGVEVQLGHLAAGLAGTGHEVEVWVPDPAARDLGTITERVAPGLVVRRFPVTRSARYPLAPALLRHARHHLDGVDVLNAHGYHTLAACALLAAPPAVPVVFTPHFHGTGHTAVARALHVPYSRVGVRLFDRADAIVAVSAAEADTIRARRPRLVDRVRVVHHGVDADAIRRARPFPDQPPTLLSIGRLERYKRVDLVLDAFARTSPGAQLVVIGDGPMRPALERRARGAVRFAGRVDDTELHRWLRTASGVVSLSEREAFGMVVLEAVAAGAHALVSDLPAHREVAALVPPGTVRIAPTLDPDGLAGELDALRSAHTDVSVPVRSWDAVARDYADLFAALVPGTNRCRHHSR